MPGLRVTAVMRRARARRGGAARWPLPWLGPGRHRGAGGLGVRGGADHRTPALVVDTGRRDHDVLRRRSTRPCERPPPDPAGRARSTGWSTGSGSAARRCASWTASGRRRGDCFADYPDFWGYWHGDGDGGWTWAGSGAGSAVDRRRRPSTAGRGGRAIRGRRMRPPPAQTFDGRVRRRHRRPPRRRRAPDRRRLADAGSRRSPRRASGVGASGRRARRRSSTAPAHRGAPPPPHARHVAQPEPVAGRRSPSGWHRARRRGDGRAGRRPRAARRPVRLVALGAVALLGAGGLASPLASPPRARTAREPAPGRVDRVGHLRRHGRRSRPPTPSTWASSSPSRGSSTRRSTCPGPARARSGRSRWPGSSR